MKKTAILIIVLFSAILSASKAFAGGQELYKYLRQVGYSNEAAMLEVQKSLNYRHGLSPNATYNGQRMVSYQATHQQPASRPYNPSFTYPPTHDGTYQGARNDSAWAGATGAHIRNDLMSERVVKEKIRNNYLSQREEADISRMQARSQRDWQRNAINLQRAQDRHKREGARILQEYIRAADDLFRGLKRW